MNVRPTVPAATTSTPAVASPSARVPASPGIARASAGVRPMFSGSVADIQSRKGSRGAYAKMEARGGWRTTLDDEARAFVEAQTSVFLGTASADGRPYIQHRGGPPGFLHVVDEQTIAFADFAGNRQFVTQGNLAENPAVYLFLIDYAEQRRVKVWGAARVIEGDAARLASLMPPGYRARGEQVVEIHVEGWDENCSQHLPQRFEAADVRAAIASRDARIEALEATLARERARASSS